MRTLHNTACCFLVDADRGHLLLLHHRRFDAWFPPGGHVEPGETPAECALRELVEETGIAQVDVGIGLRSEAYRPCPGEPPGYLGYGEYPEEGGHVFGVHFFGARLLSPGLPDPVLDEHAAAARWLDLREPERWPRLRPHVEYYARYRLGTLWVGYHPRLTEG